MIAKFLTLIPEFLILLSIVMMFVVNRFRESVTPKTFFTIAKIFLAFALLGSLVFYNRSGFPEYWRNNTFTTLFKVIIYLLSLTWFFLSCKWFLNKNRSSLRFYAFGMANILMFLVMISAENLGLLGLALLGSFVINYFMISLSRDYFETQKPARNYLGFALFFMLLFATGLVLVYWQVGSLDYLEVAKYLNAHSQSWQAIVIFACLLVPLLFMLAVAPFHFWFADVISVSILPVCGFLTLLPVVATYGCLLNLSHHVLGAMSLSLNHAVWSLAILSLFIGAISANREPNIRKLFAYSSLYHVGFALLVLVNFDNSSIAASFIYLLIYVLSMGGVYTVFFGIKSSGDYLTNLKDISGLFTQKTYVSVALLVFMISMVGAPPMLGFLGKLIAVNNLVIEHAYWSLCLAMVALLLLLNAYMEVIKSIFFEERKYSFDRVDAGIYICLFINIIIVLIAILNPGYLISALEKMLLVL